MSDNSNDVSVGSLAELKSAQNIGRVNALNDTFRQFFQIEPKFFVRVPGR